MSEDNLLQFCNYHLPVKIAGNAVDKAFISGNKSKCGSIFNIVALLVDDDLAGPVTVVFLYKTFIVVSRIV